MTASELAHLLIGFIRRDTTESEIDAFVRQYTDDEKLINHAMLIQADIKRQLYFRRKELENEGRE